jgi:hypothetical protein
MYHHVSKVMKFSYIPTPPAEVLDEMPAEPSLEPVAAVPATPVQSQEVWSLGSIRENMEILSSNPGLLGY